MLNFVKKNQSYLITTLVFFSGCGQEDDLDDDGYTVEEGDCNDYDPTIYPGAKEICDGIDQNCNEVVDENPNIFFYIDSDKDGYGSPRKVTESCVAPSGYISDSNDCVDNNFSINPEKQESIGNKTDDNCNGYVDENILPLISAGGNHSIALQQIYTYAGTVISWGTNWAGQLGNHTSIDSSRPVRVVLKGSPQQLLSGITQISAGGYHNLALNSSGNVFSWGWNKYGQIGIGNLVNQEGAVVVDRLQSVTSVSAGASHSMALDNAGYVYSWGNNFSGELGDGTTTDNSYAKKIETLSNITAVFAGKGVDGGTASFSMALKSDGTLWSWGNNKYGQLGNGQMSGNFLVPKQVPNAPKIKNLSLGGTHSLALSNDGILYSWGSNFSGQLGNGGIDLVLTPKAISGISNITNVSAGSIHSLALDSDGVVWSWGTNYNGELGDGSGTTQYSPVVVNKTNRATSISAGYHHSIIFQDNTIWGWGKNEYGELADGTTRHHRAVAAKILQIPVGDVDLDGLTDVQEEKLGTNPNSYDTDWDYVLDGLEFLLGTDLNSLDTDSDGLTDGEELTAGTDPLIEDSDLDGLSDKEEIVVYKTNPNNKDTDLDGYLDLEEITFGSDPLDPTSHQ